MSSTTQTKTKLRETSASKRRKPSAVAGAKSGNGASEDSSYPVKLSPDFVARLDAYVEHVNQSTPGAASNRSAMMRAILMSGLSELEALAKKGRK